MLKETVHFLRHAPQTLQLKAGLSQEDLYETLMQRSEAAGMGEKRRLLVQELQGEVLEIGCGTGLMFPYYHEKATVHALEPDAGFLTLAEAKAPEVRASIRPFLGNALEIPMAANSVDHVVVGLVLCSVPHVGKVLGEVRRVLRPGGAVHLIEHIRSPEPFSGFLMNVFDPLWFALNGQGCHMNRNTPALLKVAGFDVFEKEPFQVFADGVPAFPMMLMRARPEEG